MDERTTDLPPPAYKSATGSRNQPIYELSHCTHQVHDANDV